MTIGVTIATLMQDLQYSFRSLRRSPALAATCVVVLALGIGANAAIFSAVKAILLDRLPYRDPGRLVALYEAGVVKGDVHDEPAPANFYDWQRESDSFDDIAAYGGISGNLSGASGRLPEHVQGVFCSWNLFRTLGVQASLGRVFTRSDDSQQSSRTIVLSHSLWRRIFDGNPGLIGRTLRLDAQLYTIIGVMPATFEFPSSTTQYWVPMQLALPAEELQTRGDHRLSVIARLKPGVTTRQSAAELTTIQSRIARSYSGQTGTSVEVYALESELVDPTLRRSLYVLWAAVGCVLLIACVNVANLLLVRNSARRKEVAVRIALGASKRRIARLFFLESIILSLIGAAAGLLLAQWLTHVLVSLSAALPRASAIQLNWTTLLFAAGVALAAGGLAGVLPAASASAIDPGHAMHETGRTTFGSLRSTRYRSGLISVEIALSFLLLVSAGLLLKSFVRLQTVDLGFNPRNLLTMFVTLPTAQYPTNAKAATFFEQFLARVRAISGVQSAGLVSWLPAAGQYMNTDLTIIGKPRPPRDQSNPVIPRTADPGYFHALGIPLERGRTFLPQERLDKADKAIVSTSLARRYFPNEDPIGKYVSFWEKRWQIVGIVGDVRKNLDELPEPTIYVPMSSGELNFGWLSVRAEGDPLRLAIPIQRELARLDPNLAASDVLTMDQLISKRIANRHFSLLLLMSFASVAVLLAAVGLYGVISYSTAQRTSEFGVRLALGAQPHNLIRSVLRHGLAPALTGMTVGFVTAIGAVRVMQSMLFEVKPLDAAVFASVGCGLLVISFAACLIPALRATAIDPTQALRVE
ncbi:MAG: ABC transporter permease [Acidobacteriaceae bacterium]|nr:ABC transporter permease [Acidobacteriaceae bacterium]MBV9780248.1 ABC transporter permease [Acidobacteriaceae bacterium]